MSLQDFSTDKLRESFLDFFKARGHKVIPSSSLVPEDDPTVLFTTAGMQQFKRFYLFPDEAPSARIATCQKCLRTGDINEVGDETHLTFFEMLGNFSFGYPEKEHSYFKEKAIKMAWGFLTDELGLDKKRLSATYFAGDRGIPADEESRDILKAVTGLEDSKILGTDFSETFWSLGTEGSPGGPTVEFYVDGVEIWNLVFNEYKFSGGEYIESDSKGVDTGMGLERLAAVMQGKSDIYQTDVFAPIIQRIEGLVSCKYQEEIEAIRRIADHYRSTVKVIEAGVMPGKNSRESVLRTLLRVIFIEIKHLMQRNDEIQEFEPGIRAIDHAIERQFKDYSSVIKLLYDQEDQRVKDIVLQEYEAFLNLKDSGMRFIRKNIHRDMVTGEDIFHGKDTFGLGRDAVVEILEKFGGKSISPEWKEEYNKAFKKHREVSKASAGMFKGGLADNKEETTRLHTAAHLLLAALRQVLGDQVQQKGSNITEERLRFDFNHPEKLTPEQISKIEKIVNEKIKENLPVTMKEMSISEAKSSGATGVFDDRYGDKVKVYGVGDFSKEICGGPHVKSTGELGHFRITKEQSSSSGIRRIKAVLE